jgi:hypothetical protein
VPTCPHAAQITGASHTESQLLMPAAQRRFSDLNPHEHVATAIWPMDDDDQLHGVIGQGSVPFSIQMPSVVLQGVRLSTGGI